ncbi:MAG: hypothetical protein AABX54_01840 [Nanoarchaeota archaeon]
MQKLKQNSTGEYTLDNNPVTPVLVRGPYLYHQDIVDGKSLAEEEVLRRVIAEVRNCGIDLERIANSYTFSTGIVRVARTDETGKPIKAEEKRLDIVSFYRSTPKGLN